MNESPIRTGGIKFVIKSIIPNTTDFTNVIKNSNDSIDNLLEFRSLTSNSFKVDAKNTDDVIENNNNKSYSEDVKDFIKKIRDREEIVKAEVFYDESDSVENDSGQNDSRESISDLVIAKKQKINNSDDLSAAFVTMSSSTPIKLCEHRNVKLDISGVGYLNLTHKTDEMKKISSLNDSDFESMDQDQYDESPKKDKLPDNDLTLINTIKSDENRNSSKENMSIISRTSSLTDFKNGFKMIFDETVRRTPLALRRAFKIDSDSGSPSSTLKKSKFLNLFSSTKKLKRKQSSGKKRHGRSSSGSGKKKYPLTKENLQKHLQDEDKENLEWGDHFEYSFLCEPASSVVDENVNSSNYISYNTSMDSSIEMLKSPLVPKFKIDPPSDVSWSGSSSMTPLSDNYPPACDYVRHMIKCSYATIASTSLRRSMSAPAIEDNLEDDSMEFAYSQSNTTKTCEASIKNLTQLSVSIFSQFFYSPVRVSTYGDRFHSQNERIMCVLLRLAFHWSKMLFI